jgi:hypothetical protein
MTRDEWAEHHPGNTLGNYAVPSIELATGDTNHHPGTLLVYLEREHDDA